MVVTLKRGDMVILRGIPSRPELEGRHALVMADALTEGECVSMAKAPHEPDERLLLLDIEPQHATLASPTADQLGSAWNNLAYAAKGECEYAIAGAAYETALEFIPSDKSYAVICNFVKLSMIMLTEKVDDEDIINARVRRLLQFLFQPITSLPEFRGLDSVCGIDYVAGYPERMIHCGIANSVSAVPERTIFTRQFVCEPNVGIVEVHHETGQRLVMSAAAREAMRRPRRGGSRAALRESDHRSDLSLSPQRPRVEVRRGAVRVEAARAEASAVAVASGWCCLLLALLWGCRV